MRVGGVDIGKGYHWVYLIDGRYHLQVVLCVGIEGVLVADGINLMT